MADGEQELQAIVRAVLRPMFRSIWRIRVSGVENIPATGGAILTPNHTSVIDSFFLPAAAPRPVSFVGKAEYLDDWKTRKLFPALGMIPIDRSGGDASQRALDTAARVLEGGDLFAIYPESNRLPSQGAHGRCSFVDPHRLSDRPGGHQGCPVDPTARPTVAQRLSSRGDPLRHADPSGRLGFGQRPTASVASDHR
jgi:1-acyl-sn-glycerol-3-phosphate acyltransferase